MFLLRRRCETIENHGRRRTDGGEQALFERPQKGPREISLHKKREETSIDLAWWGRYVEGGNPMCFVRSRCSVCEPVKSKLSTFDSTYFTKKTFIRISTHIANIISHWHLQDYFWLVFFPVVDKKFHENLSTNIFWNLEKFIFHQAVLWCVFSCKEKSPLSKTSNIMIFCSFFLSASEKINTRHFIKILKYFFGFLKVETKHAVEVSGGKIRAQTIINEYSLTGILQYWKSLDILLFISFHPAHWI